MPMLSVPDDKKGIGNGRRGTPLGPAVLPQLQQATIQIIVFVLILGAVIALLDVALQWLLVRLPAMLVGR